MLSIMLATILVPYMALAQSGTDPEEGNQSPPPNRFENTSQEGGNESTQDNQTTQPDAGEPQPQQPPPDQGETREVAEQGEFYVDACVRSQRSPNRPYECVWQDNQRMYNRYWIIASANKPFKYEFFVNGNLVTRGEADWRVEWNSTTTQARMDIRMVLTSLSNNVETGRPDVIEYEFKQLRVRGMVGDDAPDEGEEGERQPEYITIDVSKLKRDYILISLGSMVMVAIGMMMAMAYWENRDEGEMPDIIVTSG